MGGSRPPDSGSNPGAPTFIIMNQKNKFFQKYIVFCAVLLSVIVSTVVMIPVYCSTFYVHETGHILFGKFSSYFNGQPTKYEFSATTQCPIFGWELPQRTRILQGKATVGFIFGGSLLVLLYILFSSGFLWFLTRNNLAWVFPLIFAFHEFRANFLCGTDNLFTAPYPVCANTLVKSSIHLVTPALVIVTAIFFYPFILTKINWFGRKLARKNNLQN